MPHLLISAACRRPVHCVWDYTYARPITTIPFTEIASLLCLIPYIEIGDHVRHERMATLSGRGWGCPPARRLHRSTHDRAVRHALAGPDRVAGAAFRATRSLWAGRGPGRAARRGAGEPVVERAAAARRRRRAARPRRGDLADRVGRHRWGP